MSSRRYLARVRRAADRAAGRRPCGRPTRRRCGRFPARFLVEFFDNHGMLGFRGPAALADDQRRLARYVEALTRPGASGCGSAAPVTERRAPRRSRRSISRAAASPSASTQVVIATHSDQALALLADPSERERELLGAIPYQRNEAVLHTDRSLLPRRRRAWASWNYHLADAPHGTLHGDLPHEPAAVAAAPTASSASRSTAPTRSTRQRIIRTIRYAHPVYTPAGVARAGAPRTRSADTTARTTAAPTGAGGFTRTACAARCGWWASSARASAGGRRMTASAIYEGTIRHRRFAVRAHEFRHRLALAYLDLDELDGAARRPARRRGVRAWCAFAARDYLGDPASPLADAVRDAGRRAAPASARRARSAC